ncbi:MAG: sensor histidine kinase [Acidimicrobiia bacterium]
MTDRTLILLSRLVALFIVACGVVSVIVLAASGTLGEATGGVVQQLAGTLIIPVVVLIAIPKVPRNGSVWAFAAVGVSLALVTLGDSVAAALAGITTADINALMVDESPSDLPLAAAAGITVAMSAWIVSFVLFPTLVLLLFPDGRFPAPHRWWRWVGFLSLAAISVGMLVQVWTYWPTRTTSYTELVLDNTGKSSSPSVAGSLAMAASLVGILLIVVSLVGYIIKWKRSRGEARLQYRWVGFAFFLMALNSLFTVVLSPFGGGQISDVVSWAAIVLIPVTYVVAIVKYRLYGIDVVISKTVTYGVLAVFITAVYVVVVVGVGSLIGAGDESSLALSIAAVAIVAVAVQPVHSRVQHWANVLVYGKRATPYEVLAGATERLSETRDPDEALSDVTRIVSDGTGATAVVVWLKVGDVLQPHMSTPAEAVDELVPVRAAEDAVSGIPGDLVVGIRHRGDDLGALSLSKERGDSVTRDDQKVVADVSAGAGALLRNIGLNSELAERAKQLRASRRRLVAAQDAERHRLERNLHDGAQQQVVALKVKLGVAGTLADREEAESVAELVAELAETTQEAVDGMRSVAHGIYPPLLEAEGLETALAAANRTFPVPIHFDGSGLGRYEQPVEESTYFCVVGIVRAAVDLGATTINVSLVGDDDEIRFTASTDAPTGGFADLLTVEDRLDALGGSFSVTNDHGNSIVDGHIPIRTPTLEPA